MLRFFLSDQIVIYENVGLVRKLKTKERAMLKFFLCDQIRNIWMREAQKGSMWRHLTRTMPGSGCLLAERMTKATTYYYNCKALLGCSRLLCVSSVLQLITDVVCHQMCSSVNGPSGLQLVTPCIWHSAALCSCSSVNEQRPGSAGAELGTRPPTRTPLDRRQQGTRDVTPQTTGRLALPPSFNREISGS